MAKHLPEVMTADYLQKIEHKGILKWIEKVGNKLPDPFMLFIYLSMIIIAMSVLLAGNAVTHPGDGKEVAVKSLLSTEGIHWMLTEAVNNFVQFPPLGLVLTMVLGIGLAERVGLIEAVLQKMMAHVPKAIISYSVVFVGILGNLASDAAWVIIPPVGALIFMAAGRHPLAGFAAAAAGVGSGFTANLMIAGTDALLSGITTQVAQTVDKNAQVSAVDNWFFMAASVFVLAFIGAWVTDKIVEPRLGSYRGEYKPEMAALTGKEIKALKAAGAAALLYAGVIALLVVPEGALLRDPENGSILSSPFLKGIIPIILLFFITVSVVYGIVAGRIKDQTDVPRLMGDSIKGMSGFIVLVFVISQFIAFFTWSNMGIFMAVKGADFLESIHLTGFPVLIGFSLLTCVVSLFITSGSALWALLAPVFIPMLMLLDFHPAFIQIAYRIADSATNTITPMNPYLPMLMAYYKRYKSDAGFGTVISTMIPYTVLFFLAWLLMMFIWYAFGWPIGPGVYAK
ncbi:AbgT family transporter [Bacillus halotolerans]|uniref:AbgT family transporter n=1 Tax=Bacillus halotolerans TaxID=260554 RepID=UPI001BCDBB51|nr:AbgT family transporter [Bacillus halotolerans]MCM3355816.1 AbgT family transporter [Bacillus halotolerans]QVN28453.1 AbgT family transporter [Bacillus halotolerans]